MFGKRRSNQTENDFDSEAEIGEDTAVSGGDNDSSSFESSSWSDDTGGDEEQQLIERQGASSASQSLPWIAGGALGLALLGYVGYNQFLAPPPAVVEVQGETPVDGQTADVPTLAADGTSQIAGEPSGVTSPDATAMTSPDDLTVAEVPTVGGDQVATSALTGEPVAPDAMATETPLAMTDIPAEPAPDMPVAEPPIPAPIDTPAQPEVVTEPTPVMAAEGQSDVVARLEALDARVTTLSKAMAQTSAPVPAAVDLSPVEQKMESLEASYAGLSAKLDQLTAEKAAEPAGLAPLQGDVADLKKSYAELADQVKAQAAIAPVAAAPAPDLAPLEEKITTLQASYSDLSGKIATMGAVAAPAASTDLTPLQTAVDELRASLAGVEAKLAAPMPVTATATADISPLEGRLAALETELSALKSAPAVPTDTAAPAQDLSPITDELKSLKQAYGKLESKLETLSGQPAAAAPAADLKPLQRQIQALQARLDGMSKSSAPASTSASAASTTAPTATPSATRSAKAEPWVLRAAQGEEAWISPTATGELRRVVAGDTVPGIGRIKTIRLVGDVWEVVGTTGTIRQ